MEGVGIRATRTITTDTMTWKRRFLLTLMDDQFLSEEESRRNTSADVTEHLIMGILLERM